jgi:hypothetical protein
MPAWGRFMQPDPSGYLKWTPDVGPGIAEVKV